jgi:hypothetical protein
MRCAAKRRNGQQCGAYAVKGATVCRMHGGSAPQVRAAAMNRSARAQAHLEAERMVARSGVDVDPIEHLLDSLHLAATLVSVWGQMVARLDSRGADQTWERDGIRGELGYERDPDIGDGLSVRSKDALLALNSKGQAAVHPYVVEYHAAIERRGRLAKLCIDAGVAQRQIEIVESQAKLIAQVLRGVLTELGVVDRPEVPEVVRRHLTLVSAQRAA